MASSAATVAAARLRAKLAGDPDPAGTATGRVLVGLHQRRAGRGRGQAAACTAANVAAIFATAARPRRAGRQVGRAHVGEDGVQLGSAPACPRRVVVEPIVMDHVAVRRHALEPDAMPAFSVTFALAITAAPMGTIDDPTAE